MHCCWVLDGGERPQFQPPQPSWSWEWRACKVTSPWSSALLCAGFRGGSSGCMECLAGSALSPVLLRFSLWLPGVQAAVAVVFITLCTEGKFSVCEQPSAVWTRKGEAKWGGQEVPGWKGSTRLPRWLEVPVGVFGAWMLLLLFFPPSRDDKCGTQSSGGVRRDSHRPLRRKGLPRMPMESELNGKPCRIIGSTPPNSCPPELWSRGWCEVPPPLVELWGKASLCFLLVRSTASTPKMLSNSHW